MSWEQIDDKHKRQFDAKFVSCDEDYEKEYLKKLILDSFPGVYTEKQIDAAISHCCKAIPAPRPRSTFMTCLKNELF